MRMCGKHRVDDLPLYAKPLAVHNADPEYPAFQALGDELENNIFRLIRTKQMQVESPVDRIPDRGRAIFAHGDQTHSETPAQNDYTPRHLPKQAADTLAKSAENWYTWHVGTGPIL